MEARGKVVVRRDAEDDIKMRDLYVTLDEEDERTLLYPRSFEAELPPGEHRLKITNRLASREERFVVHAGETAEIEVANVVKGGMLGMLWSSLTFAYGVRIRRL